MKCTNCGKRFNHKQYDSICPKCSTYNRGEENTEYKKHFSDLDQRFNSQEDRLNKQQETYTQQYRPHESETVTESQSTIYTPQTSKTIKNPKTIFSKVRKMILFIFVANFAINIIIFSTVIFSDINSEITSTNQTSPESHTPPSYAPTASTVLTMSPELIEILPTDYHSYPVITAISVNDVAVSHTTEYTSHYILEIPHGITAIDPFAYYYDHNIVAVVMPDSLTEIGTCAFYNNSNLQYVQFPDSLEKIGKHAFDHDYKPTYVPFLVNLPENIFIEDFAFAYNPPPASLPATAQLGVGTFDFTDKTANTTDGNFLIYGNTLVKYTGNQSVVTIPNNITIIDQYAFKDNETVTDITLPENLHTIGLEAFYKATNLQQINFPSSLRIIMSSAFEQCSSLVNVDLNHGLEEVWDTVFYSCSSLETLTIPSTLVYAESTSFAGNSWYYKNKKASEPFIIHDTYLLELVPQTSGTLEIPDGIETVGVGAITVNFINDTPEIIFPDSTEVIFNDAINLSLGTTAITIDFNDNLLYLSPNFISKSYFDDVEITIRCKKDSTAYHIAEYLEYNIELK